MKKVMPWIRGSLGSPLLESAAVTFLGRKACITGMVARGLRSFLDTVAAESETVMTVRNTEQSKPCLTFACELDPVRLQALFADASVVADLQALDARVALMLSDLSPERAGVVRRLNAANIPVIAIPLLPLEDGYYFTTENMGKAAEQYDRWKDWTAQNALAWAGVGLDIEPDARFYQQIMDNPWGLIPRLLPRLRDRTLPRQAQQSYNTLVQRIHADGYAVENYQFPLIADDRQVRSTLIERLMGIVNVSTDREVSMLYTSMIPVIGPALLWAYAPQASIIAVGSTGGGPDISGHPEVPALTWEALSRDLRLARYWSNDLYIHSLEGCVRQGFLTRLRTFDWTRPVAVPCGTPLVSSLRHVLHALLSAGEHPWRTATLVCAGIWLVMRR